MLNRRNITVRRRWELACCCVIIGVSFSLSSPDFSQQNCFYSNIVMRNDTRKHVRNNVLQTTTLTMLNQFGVQVDVNFFLHTTTMKTSCATSPKFITYVVNCVMTNGKNYFTNFYVMLPFVMTKFTTYVVNLLIRGIFLTTQSTMTTWEIGNI